MQKNLFKFEIQKNFNSLLNHLNKSNTKVMRKNDGTEGQILRLHSNLNF